MGPGRGRSKESIKAFKKAIEKKKREMMQGVRKEMRGVMMYTYRTIQNSFGKIPKKERKGQELYLFDRDGRKICPIEDFLRGAYRATGSGSFQKEKVQTRVKGSNPPGTYAEKNQQPGVYYTKGTGKFSLKEAENIRISRDPEAAQRKILREIKKREKVLDKKLAQYGRDTFSDAEKAEEKGIRKEIRALKKKHGAIGSHARAHKIRIVQHTRGDVPARDVQTHRMYPQRSKPGEPPRTRSSKDPRGGKRLSLRSGIYFEPTQDKTGFTIYAVSLSSGNLIFRNLETGGSTAVDQGKGELLGYSISTERTQTSRSDGKTQTFSHRRVSLRKVQDGVKKKKITFQPRPFFEPAKAKAVERIQDIFGEEGARFAKTAKIF